MTFYKKFCLCSAFFFLEIITGTLSYPTFAHPDAHLGGSGLGEYGGYHGGFQEAHPLVSSDHHGGVSIIGAGGSAQKGITLDLTKEHGGGHTGLFGGSFISTGSHGKSGGYYQGGDVEHVQADHSGLGSYSSALSSYDVGGGSSGGATHALTSSGHDAGEISPVLFSSYKEDEHSFGLHSAALHSGGGFDGGHFGSGLQHFEHSGGFSH